MKTGKVAALTLAYALAAAAMPVHTQAKETIFTEEESLPSLQESQQPEEMEFSEEDQPEDTIITDGGMETEESIKARYYDENGEAQFAQCRSFSLVPDCGNNIIEEGWYYVEHDMTYENRPSVVGDVKIILGGDVTLNMIHGIRVFDGQTLTIYSSYQNVHMGKLIAGSYRNQAGIGGNDEENNGTVNICGGVINAAGMHQGAGIGGGNEDSGGAINIYGGKIHAEAQISTRGFTRGVGAGIGGGDCGNAGTIRIYGGTVYAKAVHAHSEPFYNMWGAGIGSGDEGTGGTVEIYGGEIEAHGAHAIGDGKDAKGAVNITLGEEMMVKGFDYSERYDVLSYGQDVWIGRR